MIPDRHPTDELAEIRHWISKLQTREAELVATLLDDPDLREGKTFRACLRRRQRRAFLHDRLPRKTLSDPAYWAVTEDREIVTEPLEQKPRKGLVFSSARKLARASEKPAADPARSDRDAPRTANGRAAVGGATWFSLSVDEFRW